MSRRNTLAGLTAAGIGVPLLAACGGDDDTVSDPGGDAPEPDADAGPLAQTSEIPVGGGQIFDDAGVVVTQPSEGEFKAFSAVCTHQGCVVSGVSETIDCVCHNSRFSLTDGSVESGPANSPLPEVGITVEGDQISLA